MKLIRKTASFILLFVMIAAILSGCSNGSETNKSFTEMSDFENSKIGILTGSSFDLLATEYYPEAEKMHYNSVADMIISLKQDRIDGILMDKAFFTPLTWDTDELSYINMDMPVTEYAVVFAKSEDSAFLKAQMNDFISKQTENGYLAELERKWVSSAEPDVNIDLSELSGENGTLRVAADVENKPFVYLKDGKYHGFDIEFLCSFAKEYGYALEIDTLDFGALLPGVSSGKYDLAISSITITEERKESVSFSDAYHKSPVVMAVLSKNTVHELTLADFDNARLGVVTGSIYDGHSKEFFPDATIAYYQTFADLFQCVKQGKIDGFMADEPNFNSVKRVSPDLLALKVPNLNVEIGYGFQKNSGGNKLKAEMDTFIEELKADGTIDRLIEKWYGEEEPSQTLELPDFSDNKTTISVAVDSTRKPYDYILNNSYAGFEVEVLYMFCEKYGYNPVISDIPLSSSIAGLASEKFDLVAGGLYITPERKQSIAFSQPYMYADVVMVSYSNQSSDASFWDNIKLSFEKTFIREGRWKLFVDGIIVTMTISIMSMIFGSLLGFLLYLLSQSSNKTVAGITKAIGKVYSRIVAGTPVLVILMILFYLVFAEFKDLSGMVIAIVGFTLTFGAFVYDHMAVSVNSVDFGQTEAALALGYSKNRTFFKIIFPQAMTIFMPSYCGEVVSLIKATAVVGYIAVNDLTKIGDIIRSNTYEAFFPLIATAVMYFILTWIVSLLLNIVKLKFEPKRRSEKKILKGVNK